MPVVLEFLTRINGRKGMNARIEIEELGHPGPVQKRHRGAGLVNALSLRIAFTLFVVGCISSAHSAPLTIVTTTTSPPVVEEGRFSFRIGQSNSVEKYYRFRWQDGDYVVLTADSSEGVQDLSTSKTGKALGRLGVEHWVHYGAESVLQKWTDRKVSEEATNAVRSAVIGGALRVRELLNWGIPHIDPKNLVWTENEFSGTNIAKNIRVRGSCIPNSKGEASFLTVRLEVPILNEIRTFHWKISYEYAGTVSNAFPKTISVDLLRDQEVVRLYSFEEIHVHISPRRLGPQFFSPDSFLGTNQNSYTVTVSNTSMIVEDAHGKTYLAKPPDHPDYTRVDLMNGAPVYFAVILIIILLTAIAFLVIQTRKNRRDGSKT